MAISPSTSAYVAVVIVAVTLMSIAKPVAAPSSANGAGITLTSVSVTMPDSVHDYPGGDAATVMNANCTACHSPGMVLTQPKLSPAGWTEEVNKMRSVYKAPVAADDVPAIVAYLSKLKT